MTDQNEMGEIDGVGGIGREDPGEAFTLSDGEVPGYPKMASLISGNPELLMVRRFHGLNARNILYLQAELQDIEKELLRVEKMDAQSQIPDKRDYSRDYWSLKESENQEDHDQWLLVQRMTEKLKEYSELFSILLDYHFRRRLY